MLLACLIANQIVNPTYRRHVPTFISTLQHFLIAKPITSISVTSSQNPLSSPTKNSANSAARRTIKKISCISCATVFFIDRSTRDTGEIYAEARSMRKILQTDQFAELPKAQQYDIQELSLWSAQSFAALSMVPKQAFSFSPQTPSVRRVV